VREEDVLVQIHAAGVNLLDSRLRSGLSGYDVGPGRAKGKVVIKMK